MKVEKCSLQPIPTFSDYLKFGHEVSLIGAIDFTYSNGPPSLSSSLHTQVEGGENQYEQAIKAVGGILDHYDSDKKYPFFGFGGIPTYMEDQNTVNDCFPLNGDEENPEIEGIDNVIECYRQNVNRIKMMGPTRFAPVLKRTKEMIKASKNPKMYHILLLLTDGDVHDLKETIKEITEIATENLALSIVIVGVGQEEFTNMVRLDGDDIAISAGVKDIVQFVKLQEVYARSQPAEATDNLAGLVLEEIPSQMVKHFESKGMFPR